MNFKFQKNQAIKWLILVILLTVPSFTTLLQPGYFGHHDDLQIMRIHQMDKCVKDGQLPCRWVPDMGYGYGYPLFNYYPVMPYYLGELIHLLGISLVWSVKIVFILSLIVSAITMFILGKTLWGNLGGLATALFYVYAPYHAVDIYVRGALAESWSIAFAPAVFWAIYLVINENKTKYIPILAIFVSLFLMSHNPLALIFTPIMILWALLLLFQKGYFNLNKVKQTPIFKLIIGGIWGLGLAAFFTLPVLFEAKLVHIETLFIGYFNYLAHFVDLKQLFISDFWGFGGSIWGPEDGMPFQVGKLHTAITLASLPLAILIYKKSKIKSLILILMIIVFWGSTFLMHPRSNFIWERIQILQNLQFPWRLLSVTIFASSILVGGLFLEVKKSWRVALLVSLILGIFIVYQPLFKIEKRIPLTDQEKLSGALWDLQRTAGIFDYLPKTAKLPPGKGAPETVSVIEGSGEIKDFKRGTDWLSFSYIGTESATLRLPIIDYPQWRIKVDNKTIAFDNQNELGQPTFKIDSGNHSVYAKLYNTPIRILANIISLLAVVFLIIYLKNAWVTKKKK